MPLTEGARLLGIRSNMEKRAYNDDRVLPSIVLLLKAGESMAGVVRRLGALGIESPRAGNWSVMQVMRIIRRWCERNQVQLRCDCGCGRNSYKRFVAAYEGAKQ